jgi:hypothetical protein
MSKLSLSKETLVRLDPSILPAVVGGTGGNRPMSGPLLQARLQGVGGHAPIIQPGQGGHFVRRTADNKPQDENNGRRGWFHRRS